MQKLLHISSLVALVLFSKAWAEPISSFQDLPETCEQLVIGLVDTKTSSFGHVVWFEKKRNGEWEQERVTPARFGKNGLAEGIGVKKSNLGLSAKREGDGKTPAGLFSFGAAFGYDKKIKKKKELPYVQVTPYALFVEDPNSPYYNQYRRLHRLPETDWEKKQQMKQDDPAHALKLFVNHNTIPQRKKGAGSAIFLHIWREEGEKPTTGCTVMSEKSLERLIKWVDPTKSPLFLVTTKASWKELVDLDD